MESLKDNPLENLFKQGIRYIEFSAENGTSLSGIISQKINGDFYIFSRDFEELDYNKTFNISKQVDKDNLSLNAKKLSIIANAKLCVDYYTVLPEVFFYNSSTSESVRNLVTSFRNKEAELVYKQIPNLDYYINITRKEKVKFSKKAINQRYTTIIDYKKLVDTENVYYKLCKEDLALTKAISDNEIAYVIYRYIKFLEEYREKLLYLQEEFKKNLNGKRWLFGKNR